MVIPSCFFRKIINPFYENYTFVYNHLSTLPKNNLSNISFELTDFSKPWKFELYWSPFGKGCDPYLIKLEFLLILNALCQVWFRLALSSKNVVKNIFDFFITSLWIKTWSLLWVKVNSPFPRIICVRVWYIFVCVRGNKDCWNVVNVCVLLR